MLQLNAMIATKSDDFVRIHILRGSESSNLKSQWKIGFPGSSFTDNEYAFSMTQHSCLNKLIKQQNATISVYILVFRLIVVLQVLCIK